MKSVRFLPVLFALAIVTLLSCKKEKVEAGETTDLPAPNQSSTLTLTLDNQTYTLEVMGQSFNIGSDDTARLKIDAIAPEVTLRLRANSIQHTNGVGDYYLPCCSNDVYDKRTAVKKHWEIDQRGTTQNSSVKITRMDAKGYEGTYKIYSNDSGTGDSGKKEFTGTFTIVY